MLLLDEGEQKAAEAYLANFNPMLARQGAECYARRQLGTIWLIRNGDRIRVPLPDLSPAFHRIETELTLNEGQWSISCTCRRQSCIHSYASILALQAIQQKQAKKAPRETARSERKLTLRQLFRQKLGRSLRYSEDQFAAEFPKLQEKIGLGKHTSYHDFQGILELYWQMPNFSPLREKASSLPTPQFLQEFAAFCAVRNTPLPSFLNAVLDQAAIQRALAEQRRKEEIETWKHNMVEMARGAEASPPIDCALRIAPPTVQLLLKPHPDAIFKKTSLSNWAKIVEGVAEGTRTIVPEALPILNGFVNADMYQSSNDFDLDEPWVRCLVSSLLRNPAMQDRLFNADFDHFTHVEAPLQWRLMETDDGDYELLLAHADGTPAPKNLQALPGVPYLYLGPDVVYHGPPKPKALAQTKARIPAPALESNEGLSLLSKLQLPLPSRLQARTRTIRLEPVVQCKLRTYPQNQQEYCFIAVSAGSVENGVCEIYRGDGWQSARTQNGTGDVLYMFDRTDVESVPPWLEGLGASWEFYENSWRVKITRNFPEKFLQWYSQAPGKCRFELDPELASLVRDPIKARVTLECEEVSVDWFDLRTTVNVDDTTLTPEEIKLLLNAKGKAVRLAGKGWRRLEYQLTEEDDQSLARLGLSPHDFSAEPQRLHALQLSDRAAEKMLAAEQYQKIRDRAHDIRTRVTPALPATVTATLRPYQTEGFHFLAYLAENNFGGILADDMGLGKTVQTLTWLEWIRHRQRARKPSLVVCPKSVMENWRAEALKFAPELKVQLWRGADSAALASAAVENDLLVLNYSQLRSLAASAAQMQWHTVILDEAQYIKNPDSQTAQAARALRAEHRLALSGTPIENRLLDLWSLMAFAMPGVLGNRADFKRRFDQQNDPFARRRLSARVRPFLLRRTKNQVAAELPDRIEEDMICEMEGVQKDLYRAEFKRAQQLLLKIQTQAELNEFRFNFLSSLLRLRQICCHPALVDVQRKKEESAKLSALIDLLEPLMEEGYKVLVFSQFVEMLQLIREQIDEQQWKYFYLDGSSENRGDLVDGFQNHSGPAVFLISLKAGGFGLNLTAASYVVLYDPWWNPAVENQAIDRTHRIGQTQKVIAYRLLTKNSIEQKIRELQRHKSALAQNILGDESFASSLTIEDLRFLFEEDATDA